MGIDTHRIENDLLAALPEPQLARLSHHLELVPMPLGRVLYEPDVPQGHVYFPANCIVSLGYMMEDGHSAEIAAVGHEGMVGVQLYMGGETMPNRAQVRSAGFAYRMGSAILRREFGASRELQDLLLRYALALFNQTALTAACNRLHSVDQLLCRSLLFTLDCLGGSEIRMTQELMAGMIGVRREGITEAAGKLQAAGIIRYRRGSISVLSRQRLEKRCCECYQVVKPEFMRLLPRPAALARAA